MEERLLSRLKTIFLISAGVILSATALAKLYSTLGSARVLDRADDLFGLPNRWILFGVGAVELAVVCVLLLSRVERVKVLSLLWLSSMFGLYRGAKWYFHVTGPCKCLGSLTEKLGIKPETVESVMTGVAGYLFLGSLVWLALEWRRDRRTRKLRATPDRRKSEEETLATGLTG